MVRKSKKDAETDFTGDANKSDNRSDHTKAAEKTPRNSRRSTQKRKFTPEEIKIIVANLVRYMARLTVLNDLIIKHLLGEPGVSEESLRDFINAVRIQSGQSRIMEVIIGASENFPIFFGNKITFLDIKARDEEGTWYNIEIQLVNHPHFTNRLLYYWAKLHASQLAEGAGYEEIHPTISITLTTFDLFPGLPEAFQSFHLSSDRHPETHLTDDIQFYVIQLTPNMRPERLDNLCQDLLDWIYFLNFPYTTEEQMINALLENPGVAETGMALTNFVCDEQRRAFLEAREKNRRDLADIELGGFQRGVELGEKRGEKRGLKRGVELGEKRGIELGEKRGALRGKVQLIIELLLLKTNSEIPNSLQETLYKIDDPAVLKSLFVQAMSVTSIAEFEKAVENAGLN